MKSPRRTVVILLITLALLVGWHRIQALRGILFIYNLHDEMESRLAPRAIEPIPMVDKYSFEGLASSFTHADGTSDVHDPMTLRTIIESSADEAEALESALTGEPNFIDDWNEASQWLDEPLVPFIDYTQQSKHATIIDLRQARTLARVIVHLARLRRLQRRPNEAARLLLAGLAIPRQIEAQTRRRNGVFMAHDVLAVTACIAILADELLRLDRHPGLPLDMMSEGTRRIGAIMERYSYLAMAIPQERMMTTTMTRFINEQISGHAEGLLAPFAVDSLQDRTDSCIFPPDTIYSHPAVQATDEYQRTRHEFRRYVIFGAGTALFELFWNPNKLFLRSLLLTVTCDPSLVHARELRSRVLLQGVLIAWHLEQHQRQHNGRYPPSLTDCEPPIPHSAIIDPHTGEHLLYRISGGKVYLSAASMANDGSLDDALMMITPRPEAD